MLDRTGDGGFDAVDMAALRAAMAMAEAEPEFAAHLKELLEDRPWWDVALTAVYHFQCKTLNLRPWQTPPGWVGEDHSKADQELLNKMLDAGLSQWEPNPLAALARAKRRR